HLLGFGDVTNSQFVTISQINNELLVFTPAANSSGAAFASFDFQVRDSSSQNDPTPKTMTIDVTAIDDAPVVAVPAPHTVVVNVNKAIAGISVADIDIGTSPLKVTLSALNGILSLSTVAGLIFSAGDGMQDMAMTFTGSLAGVNAAINNLVYR